MLPPCSTAARIRLSRCSTWEQNSRQPLKPSPNNRIVVFAIVGFPDVREVFLAPRGHWPAARPGSILVDMTTSEPMLARGNFAAAKEKGDHSLDAPVSGGDVGHKNAALSIMIGGDKEVVEAVTPIFECMGKTIIHQGAAGSGQHTKMVNQILIASNMVAVCEGCSTATRRGSIWRQSSSRSASARRQQGAGSAGAENHGPQFEPGFTWNISSRTWASPRRNRRELGLCHAGTGAGETVYIGGTSTGIWPQGDAGADAGAGAYFECETVIFRF